MIALDTSLAVPALLAWHEAHDQARAAARDGVIPAHALLEAYSVLTRLPAPHRLTPDVASDLLAGWFPAERILVPDLDLTVSLVPRLAEAGVTGGAAYDALVGLTAAQQGAELRTRDRRAAATYQALAVTYEMVGM